MTEKRIYRKSNFFRDDFPLAVRLATNRKEDYNLTKRFRREFWKIACIFSGSGRFVIHDQSYPIRKGSLLLVHPGAETTFDIDSDALEVCNIVFDPVLVEEFLKSLRDDFRFFAVFNPDFHQTEQAALYLFDSSPKIDAILRDILREYDERGSNWREFLKLQLQTLLLLLLRSAEKKIHHRPAQIVAYVKRRIEHDFASPLRSGGLAENIGVTPNHLCRLYRKMTGNSIVSELKTRRLAHAAQLLCETESDVLDICFRSGFRDLSYFYRAFESRYGKTPADYRKTFGQN